MPAAITVDKVSKQYRIYDRPGDRLKESLTRGRLRRHKEFWALRDVSFAVEAGTTVGIVGPNGCGKSTLLQIICGTLEPTHGEVWSEGRIAALLELGAGFDPEFTGVENVYMNASLLGFSRRETDALFPTIERFAEIGPFLHQPVKTYSSGMYVRLAFAIAASVEPDILVIDEALAVGDAVFQHRCLRRIKELQEGGTTILFVSHDTAAIRALCTRAILINGGQLLADGKPLDVLNRYQRIIMEREEAYEAQVSVVSSDQDLDIFAEPVRLTYSYRHGDGSAEIVAAEIKTGSNEPAGIIETGEQVTIRMVTAFKREIHEPVIGFLIRNRHGIHAYGTNTKEKQIKFGVVPAGKALEVNFKFDCWLGVDQYSISFAVHSSEDQAYDWMDGVLFFRVTSSHYTEGVANLNATVSFRRYSKNVPAAGSSPTAAELPQESVEYGRRS
jgi:lipopolysaccharide transport system ATP-binding protein